ncbi:MAG: exodeoxyribonuclease VII small subunit [Clostridia bacterium]|jgi:exodeoxyribonuclease VII small subunit|nr:exodeoxyribonuclease VII small subunit [Clostridia bacterium]
MIQAFENDMIRLEEIVNLLNSDKISLHEGLELLEEGVGLVKKCNEQLEKGKGKLQMLLEGDKGVAVWDACELEGDM